MGGFFLRPKDTNLDKANDHINAEAIGVIQEVDNEFIPTTGFDPSTNSSLAEHRRDPERREAKSTAPLPTGGWRGAVSRAVRSGFGKGTRAGNTGVRRR
jgi:hypothetical protein